MAEAATNTPAPPSLQDEASALLAARCEGVYLTPEGREMVLRALDDVEVLRNAAQVAERDAQAWQTRALAAEAQARRSQTKLGELRELLHDEDSPAALQEVAIPPAAPAEPAGDVPWPRWGHVVGPPEGPPEGTWHLWPSEESGEALCEETTDDQVYWLPDNGNKPDAESTCLDCAALAGWDGPQETNVAAGGAERQETPQKPAAAEVAPRCKGKNKSPAAICFRPALANGYCGRHKAQAPTGYPGRAASDG